MSFRSITEILAPLIQAQTQPEDGMRTLSAKFLRQTTMSSWLRRRLMGKHLRRQPPNQALHSTPRRLWHPSAATPTSHTFSIDRQISPSQSGRYTYSRISQTPPPHGLTPCLTQISSSSKQVLARTICLVIPPGRNWILVRQITWSNFYFGQNLFWTGFGFSVRWAGKGGPGEMHACDIQV